MNTISVNELRELLQNAWAAGFIARDAGLSPVEATTTRAKYVESKVAPYVPAKVEEVRKEERKPDLFKDVDMEKIFKDFFQSLGKITLTHLD